MGISPVTLDQYTRFHELQIFKDVSSVFELGSQDVACPEHVKELTMLLRAFGVEHVDPEAVTRLANMGSGRELYRSLGFTYQSIDTDGRHGALPIDLNFDAVPRNHRNRYDFVTNLGTSEHVANQMNCFRVVHDLTRVGGYMYHEVPFTGFVNHGLFNYTPKFFWMLCRSNLYEYVDMFIWTAEERRFLHPDILPMARCSATEETFSHQDSVVCCLMRKSVRMSFVPPLDGDLSAADPRTLSRYWTVTNPRARMRIARIQSLRRLLSEAVRRARRTVSELGSRLRRP
jgi:hypothetical protein